MVGKNHGDLIVGDEVISPNGEFVKVLEVHPKDMVDQRITFEDGETVDCHKEHLWKVYDKHSMSDKVVDTQFISDNIKTKCGRNRFHIPKKNI